MMTCSRISSRLPLRYSRSPPRSLCTLATYVVLLFRNSTLHRGSSITVHLFGLRHHPRPWDARFGAIIGLIYRTFLSAVRLDLGGQMGSSAAWVGPRRGLAA